MLQVKHWKLKLLIGVAALVVVVSPYPWLNRVAMVPVTEKARYFVVVRDVQYFSGRGLPTSDPPKMLPWDVAKNNQSSDYVVYEGELYLKVQEIQGTLLDQIVTTYEWPKAKVRQLVKDHPELEVYTK